MVADWDAFRVFAGTLLLGVVLLGLWWASRR